VKLRKFKKAQAKASRDAKLWAGGVPVMDVPAQVTPSRSLEIKAALDALNSETRPGGPVAAAAAPTVATLAVEIPEDAAAAADAGLPEDAAIPEPEAEPAEPEPEAEPAEDAASPATADADADERVALAETMYRAAQARLEAAEAREQTANDRLRRAEAAERAAAERTAAIETGERAVAERLAVAEARERTAAERVAAADSREQAAAGRAAAAEARERALAERDSIANQRDRAAAERDAIANERDRVQNARGGVPAAMTAPEAGGVSAAHELEIARLEAELERSHLDSLTGALRREIGRLTLHNEIERARRTDGRFVLAFIDVDDLKGINDREGHAAGDRVLRTLAATLRANLRTYDPVVRYGGDEFVCGITGVNAAEVEHRVILIDQSLRRATGVGISAGIATLREGETLDEITARADDALLEAKRNRDR
jgi:diguanylate cyclase (GGDEF)-like protein